MTVDEICAALEAWAPPGLAYEWDRQGLAIGHPDKEVRKVLVALTITGGAAAMAVKRGADLIVSHHPLIRDPLKNLRRDTPHTRLCLELARADIACFSAHTNLDIAPGGVNDILAQKLGLQKCRPLLPVPQDGQVKLVTFVPESHLAAVRDAICRAGAGIIGNYTFCTFSAPGTGTFLPGAGAAPFSGEKDRLNEEPERRLEAIVSRWRLGAVIDALKTTHPYEEAAYDVVPLLNQDSRLGIGVQGELARPVALEKFASSICSLLELDHARVVGDLRKSVHTVAMLGGAGGGEIGHIPDGIDVFVTGDIKYHDAVAASERGMAIIDAGHAGTEKCIVPVIVDYLKKRFDEVQILEYTEPEAFHIVVQPISDF